MSRISCISVSVSVGSPSQPHPAICHLSGLITIWHFSQHFSFLMGRAVKVWETVFFYILSDGEDQGIWWIAPEEMLLYGCLLKVHDRTDLMLRLRHRVQMMRCCTHSDFSSGGPKTEAGRCFPDWDRSISNDLTWLGRRYVTWNTYVEVLSVIYIKYILNVIKRRWPHWTFSFPWRWAWLYLLFL